ncbi:hypothetical protein [Thiocystis violacea]|uniref:hypothetical protein n=1 Tax=Thiocystis violacea TaxID=13725 RepID=UPI0019070C43|nr:hypothetical protein [Thiocystis violacea]MBK1719079.1 hypothetical protein [Thiocystis violacea]
MALKDLVISTLDNANVSRIVFSFGPVAVDARSYTSVKDAVRNDRITVVHVPSLGVNRASYRYTHNMFRLGFTAIGGSADRQALLVHEATHAIFDINEMDMKVKESEAGAYIAQCLFFYYVNERAIEGGASPTFADPILQAAWPIAVGATSTPNIPVASLEPLYRAIANSSQYSGTAEDDIDYNGV